MGDWWSIEVFDGATSASRWSEQHGDALVQVLLDYEGTDWAWHNGTWGVVFEVELPDEEAWDRFRSDPRVVAALDSVPDPANGLIVHRGRGGSAGWSSPRRRPPLVGSGAAALPIPIFEELDEDRWPTEPRRLRVLATA